MNDPARPWHKRAIDALKIIPQVGGAFLAGGGAAALTKAITATAAQFFVEVAAKGDKEEALKRSGLTYLLRLRAFQDSDLDPNTTMADGFARASASRASGEERGSAISALDPAHRGKGKQFDGLCEVTAKAQSRPALLLRNAAKKTAHA